MIAGTTAQRIRRSPQVYPAGLEVVVYAVARQGLTSAGRRKHAKARRAGDVAELPESPEHRAWRLARAAAAERIDGFGELLSDAMEEATTSVPGPGAFHRRREHLCRRRRPSFIGPAERAEIALNRALSTAIRGI
jgi:hypothetical protein